ncbi:dimethyladenosine transferase 2, mitochondrial [Periplaneta americana]|uniref:dimethyladenosine transferase 2, mitochondrial n=1 Tax=Periplaneta americana TaxID=6978 RepID=UPI0037E72CB9
MCIKIFTKNVSPHSSYSVIKVLLRQLNVVPTSTSDRYRILGSFLMGRNYSTRTETQTNVVHNDTEGAKTIKKKRIASESRKTKPSNTSSTEILDYMNSKPSLKSLLNHLPEKLLKRKRAKPDAFYAIDSDVANKLVELIGQDVVKGGVPVYEANPGLGLISKHLLNAGVQRLCVCEPSPSFSQQMKDLKNAFPERVKDIKMDIFALGKMTYLDNVDGGSRIQTLFQEVPKADWTDDPVVKIIGVVPSQTFIKYLIRSHTFQAGLFSYGRPELYLLMSPQLYFYLTCKPSDGNFLYRYISVLFQLTFQWSLLDKLPRKAFLPWENIPSIKKRSKLTKMRSIDPDVLYLVKIVPRHDFFKSVVPVDQLPSLWYFVRHNMMSRKNRVIPQLEKWIPGCGPRIITGGMTIHTQFGELTPKEILSIFRKFVSWPEFPVCPFLASMETIFMKMEPGSDDIGKESDEEEEEVPVVEDEIDS